MQKGNFMSRKGRKVGYSPYYGTGRKRGPCRKRGHWWRDMPETKMGDKLQGCRRCGIERDRPEPKDKRAA